MNLVTLFLQQHKKGKVTVTIHVTDTTMPKFSQENVYSLTLEDIHQENNIPTAIVLSNGENMAAESTMTLKLPFPVNIREVPNGLSYAYVSAAKNITVTITAKPKTVLQHSPSPQNTQSTVFQDEKPFVRDFKDSHGNITKIMIKTPATHDDRLYFEQIRKIVESLLREWRTLSLARKRAGTATWLNKNVRFDQIATVFIPGESFFQISGYEGKELVTIDLAPSMTISVQNRNILFDFDDVSYELVQSK